MPIYGYECDKCGHRFETLVRSGETPACPSCESTKLSRQLSLIAPPSKGGGDASCETATGCCGRCPGGCG